MKKKTRAIIWLFATFLLGFFGIIAQHEEVHVQINTAWGLESEVEFFAGNLWTAQTIADGPCPTDECVLAHNINEAVGYTIQSLYTGIFIIFIIYVSLNDDLFREDWE